MAWYTNVYSVTRCYGGPEEGGWWYDEGEPVESLCFSSEPAAHQAADELHLKYPRNKEIRCIDFWICVEKHPAQPFPKVRPHYE
jgi:hypothetical protein